MYSATKDGITITITENKIEKYREFGYKITEIKTELKKEIETDIKKVRTIKKK